MKKNLLKDIEIYADGADINFIKDINFSFNGYTTNPTLMKNENIFNLPMYIYGVSLGTGPATYLATQVEADGLILHAPYTSIYAVAKHMFKIVFARWGWVG